MGGWGQGSWQHHQVLRTARGDRGYCGEEGKGNGTEESRRLYFVLLLKEQLQHEESPVSVSGPI